MKAIVYSQYGPPEVLRVADIERPEPARNEVLIRVRAAEVTKADCEIRALRFAVHWLQLPMRLVLGVRQPRRQVLGGYFAGVVEAVGEGVDGFAAGDEIYGCTGLKFGAHAEYLVLPARSSMAPKPHNLTFEQAAAVPLGGLNALHFLSRANIAEGERVLVNGAGGSIGTFAVQIAKTMGAEVTAVDRGDKEAMLRDIGVDDFIDYEKASFADSDRRWHVILSMVAGARFSDCMRALEPGGRYLMANPTLAGMARSLTARFSHRTAFFAFAGETVDELNTLTAMIEAGSIRPVVDRVYGFDDAAEAHRRVESEERLGIVVIRP